MARSKRVPSPTGVYHWITRGINKKFLFHTPVDFLRFKALIAEYKDLYGIRIYHYCLMNNHVHILLFAPNLESLGKFSHFILRRYTYYYCKTHAWAGSLFQKGYKSPVVDKDAYLLECGRYIERNPLKAGLCKKVEDYPYSSFRFYSMGLKDDLLVLSPAYLGLSDFQDQRQKMYYDYTSQDRLVDELMDRKLMPV